MSTATAVKRLPPRIRFTSLAALLAIGALIATASLAAFTGAATRPAASASGIQDVVDRWRSRTPVHAVTVAISDPDAGLRTVVSGTEADQPVDADARFRVGSITKTFVATVVMQLVEEQGMRLDAPLGQYVPESPWRDVTIRELLTHTGGVPDHEQAAGYTDAVLDTPDREWTTAQVLALVADRDDTFAPGTGYAYSNTGYFLLGQAIEAVTGHSWTYAVHERIITPLGLRGTAVAGTEDVADDVVTGWFDTSGDGFDDPVRGPWPALDTTQGPAGALISTAPDLAVFARALFDGDLVSPAARREMTAKGRFHPPHSNYGLGVELRQPDRRTVVWGHGGSMPGFRATMWYLPVTGRIIVALTNSYRASTDDLAQLLFSR